MKTFLIIIPIKNFVTLVPSKVTLNINNSDLVRISNLSTVGRCPDTQPNGILHKNTQNNNKKHATQHNDTQHKDN